MDKTSDASGYGEMAGIRISAVGFPEVGAPVMKVSSTVGTVASFTSGAIDVAKGNVAKGLTKVVATEISALSGK